MRSYKAHLAPPILRVVKKIDNLLAGIFREVAFAETGIEYVVPIGKHVQADVILRQIIPALMLLQTVRGIIKNTQTVRHLRSRRTDADIEPQLA